MERTIAAHRARFELPRPADLLRSASRILRRARLRRRLALALGGVALLAVGWMLLRDSPLVSVDHVQIKGVHGLEAANIRAALEDAAHKESTLHVRMGLLRAAVAPYRVVSDLRVSTGFPHDMRITVIERLPVAALVAGGQRTAVAADGTLLGPDLATDSTPAIDVPSLPSGRVADARTLDQLAVLGAAPAPLARLIVRISSGSSGISVGLRNGPSVIFGDASRAHAKWLSAARVLADPTSAGASYIDVRMPERPAAGGLPTTATGALGAASAAGQVTATDPTAAALAAGLGAAVGATGSATATGAGAIGLAGATAGGPAPGMGTAGTTAPGTTAAGTTAAAGGPDAGPSPAGTAPAGAAAASSAGGASPSNDGANAYPNGAAGGGQTASGQPSTSTGG